MSLDGTRVAVDIRDLDGLNVDVWIWDLARETLTQLTFDATTANEIPPWSSFDGKLTSR